jgi:hypothetical protein
MTDCHLRRTLGFWDCTSLAVLEADSFVASCAFFSAFDSLTENWAPMPCRSSGILHVMSVRAMWAEC